MQATTAALYGVVLRVRLGNGTWELPFFPLSRIEGSNNWERAEALRRRILALGPAVPQTEPASPPAEPPPVVA